MDLQARIKFLGKIHKLRCKEIDGYAKRYDKEFMKEMRERGSARPEIIAARVMKELGVKDPAEFYLIHGFQKKKA